MARAQRPFIVLVAAVGLLAGLSQPAAAASLPAQQPPAQGTQAVAPTFTSSQIVDLVSPIALYPDALLSQILVCSTSPFQVRGLNEWLKKNKNLKGSAVLQAAQKEGFDQNFVSIAVFPEVVKMMADKMEWTKQLGEAFTSDRKAVFDWIQRLRAQAEAAGNLKDTPQQQVETQATKEGTQIIVIEPTNPQVIYVPQYNPQVVYTQPAPTTTTVVVHEDNDSDVAAAAVIGFTAGIIIGAASDPYWGPYWGPYGWYGGGYYMYDEAWDDFYDHREDMWEDWQENRTDRTESRQENRTERQGNRQENRTERQGTRDERQTDRQGTRDERQTGRQEDRSTRQEGRDPLQDRRDQAQQRQTDRSAKGGDRASQRPSNMDSRGYSQQRGQQASRSSSGSRSSGFSGYERGSASRSSSSRGHSSMGSSRGGGGRSRGGGGGRRR